MKQLYLFALCLFFASAVFSQQKFEFGFVVKAGTFTLPHKKTVAEDSYEYSAGLSSSYGVFAARRLGGHFGLSVDLLYNFSTYRQFSREIAFILPFSPTPGVVSSIEFRKKRSISAHSLIIPLQIHFSPKKNGKLTLNAGAALNAVMSSEMTTRTERILQNPTTEWRPDPVRQFGDQTLFQTFLIAGVHYRMEQRTAIGLEFTGLLRRDQPTYWNWEISALSSFACDCYNTYDGTPFWMQSLVISLRHNILR